MRNVDDHPLRHRQLTHAIEQVLFKRALQRQLDGQILETTIEIVEVVEKFTKHDIETLREAIDLMRGLCVRLVERLEGPAA